MRKDETGPEGPVPTSSEAEYTTTVDRLHDLEARHDLITLRLEELKQAHRKADRQATAARKRADDLRVDIRLLVALRDATEGELHELRQGRP